jgi:NAD+ diphosphatase
MRGHDLLMESTTEGPRVLARERALGCARVVQPLGTFAGRRFELGLAGDAAPAAGLQFVPARTLLAQSDPGMASALGHAVARAEFEEMHRHCGRCAGLTEPNPEDRGRRCPRCGALFYPRITPAVIVLIERDGKFLLARGPRHPPGMRSVLAGFAEVGESLEEATAREVREEVGLEIGELRYFASQPWPFGHSLMVGFFARHEAGEIRVDGVEILEADWFAPGDALPALPGPFTIARQLIDAFCARNG